MGSLLLKICVLLKLVKFSGVGIFPVKLNNVGIAMEKRDSLITHTCVLCCPSILVRFCIRIALNYC